MAIPKMRGMRALHLMKTGSSIVYYATVLQQNDIIAKEDKEKG